MQIIGTRGGDALEGSSFVDQIIALQGNDTLSGLGGDDWIFGAGGSDQIFGGLGADHLWGGTGNDAPFRYIDFTVSLTIEHAGGLFGGAGNDSIDGGGGVDLVRGGDGNDVIHGSGGDDAHVDYFIDVIEFEALGGLFGGAGDDIIFGDSGNDALDGGDDNDTLSGGSGNDTLIGGDGIDDLNGNGGSNTLNGGAGPDRIRSEMGSDRIVYTAIADGGDFISGFAAGADRIDLFLIDADSSTPENDTFAFAAAQNPSVIANTVTWFQDVGMNQTIIQADVTGDAVADFVITLDGLISLSLSDFIL